MKEILNILLEYIISYALVFLLYYFLFIRKKAKYNKNKLPVEYYYIVSLYSLKDEDINYKGFMYISLFVNTFIIVTTYMIVFRLLDNWIWRFICGLVIIILLIIICYDIIGRYYQRKKLERRK